MKIYSSYENKELIFRLVKRKDIKLLNKWYYSNTLEEFVFNKSNCRPRKWYRQYRKDPTAFCFIIEEKSDNIPIGIFCISVLDATSVKFDGYVIKEKCAKGKGYGIKIMNLVQEFLFIHIEAKYSYLEVFCNNRAAVETYVKCGYKIKEVVEVEGKDMYVMRAVNK